MSLFVSNFIHGDKDGAVLGIDGARVNACYIELNSSKFLVKSYSPLLILIFLTPVI